MPLTLKGSKIKKVDGGSTKDKSVKLKDIKDLVEKKPAAAVVVAAASGASAAALAGVKYKLTMPGGKSQSGVVDASGGLGAQLEKEGSSKLEFTSLVAALNIATAPADTTAAAQPAAASSSTEEELKISVDKEVAGHNETITFKVEGSPSGTVNWSGGGAPATGTGNEFVTRFTAKGDHTIQATLNGKTASKTVHVKEASGSAWVSRFPTSASTSDLTAAFKTSADNFIAALNAAGATVSINATYRPAERAYLMHYSWKIAKNNLDPATVPAKDGVDISWLHRDASGNPDLPASKTAAQAMVNGYGITYAPSLTSLHIEKRAIDMDISWSGTLTIKNASGTNVVITTEPRTGAGNTNLHAVGATYGAKKLVGDAPHWSDTGN